VRSKGSKASEVIDNLLRHNIIAGIDLGRFREEWRKDILIAVTELHTREDLDRLIEALSH
jgi:glycine dehydrogenase subunit 1